MYFLLRKGEREERKRESQRKLNSPLGKSDFLGKNFVRREKEREKARESERK